MSAGLFDTITTTLLHSQNQFASGGLLLMVIGGIVAYLKGIPAAIYRWFNNQFTLSLTVNDEHDAFKWLSWWFQNQKYVKKRMRNMDAFTPYVDKEYQMRFKPAPGTHWFFYNYRPLFIAFSRTEDKKGYSSKRNETYTVWTFGRNQKYMLDLLTEVHKVWKVFNTDKPTLQVWRGTYWAEAAAYSPRSLESVILPKGKKESLLKDIDCFKRSEGWYEDMGIPFHRGYLFYGPPGTGKTSLVTGLSSHYKCSVYILKLSETTDSKLIDAISDVADGSMVVLEDVDCALHKRGKISASEQVDRQSLRIGAPGYHVTVDEAKKALPKNASMSQNNDVPYDAESDDGSNDEPTMGVTLSGLLNALDGLQTPKGVMFFMTTNFPEKLDAALLRPGRTDVRLYLGPATTEQKVALYKRFFPADEEAAATEFVAQMPNASMAEMQEALMQKRNQTEEEEHENCSSAFSPVSELSSKAESGAA
jgi:chaperone BCS1